VNDPNIPDVPVMDIDGTQYALSDLSDQQNEMVAQIADIENQLRANEFTHRQLIHGRTAYITALKTSLEDPDGSKSE